MKATTLLAVSFLVLLPVFTPAAPPSIGIADALKLAQEDLASRGLDTDHYIDSLTLESSTITGGAQFWFAHWVPAVKSEKKTETGLRINMDGSLARLVSGGPGSSGAGRPDGPGIRRFGARDMR